MMFKKTGFCCLLGLALPLLGAATEKPAALPVISLGEFFGYSGGVGTMAVMRDGMFIQGFNFLNYLFDQRFGIGILSCDSIQTDQVFQEFFYLLLRSIVPQDRGCPVAGCFNCKSTHGVKNFHFCCDCEAFLKNNLQKSGMNPVYRQPYSSRADQLERSKMETRLLKQYQDEVAKVVASEEYRSFDLNQACKASISKDVLNQLESSVGSKVPISKCVLFMDFANNTDLKIGNAKINADYSKIIPSASNGAFFDQTCLEIAMPYRGYLIDFSLPFPVSFWGKIDGKLQQNTLFEIVTRKRWSANIKVLKVKDQLIFSGSGTTVLDRHATGGNVAIQPDKPYLYNVVYDGKKLNFYVNGVFMGDCSFHTDGLSVRSIAIGKMSGSIKDLVMFQQAFDATDIQALFEHSSKNQDQVENMILYEAEQEPHTSIREAERIKKERVMKKLETAKNFICLSRIFCWNGPKSERSIYRRGSPLPS